MKKSIFDFVNPFFFPIWKILNNIFLARNGYVDKNEDKASVWAL